MNRTLAIAVPLCCQSVALAATIPLQNGSFETGSLTDWNDGVGIGHAALPGAWTSPSPGNSNVSGDTWSHLGGARGLFPTTVGVFPEGMTAHDGDRWAGGWSFEYISQPLLSALVAGETYTITAAVHASHYGSGGSVEISFGNSVSDRSIVAGVLAGVTTLSDGWQVKSLTFQATEEMAAASWFHFRPFSFTGEDIYMAVDAIPAPSCGALVALASLAVARRRRL